MSSDHGSTSPLCVRILTIRRVIHTGLPISFLAMSRDICVRKRVLPHHRSDHRHCRRCSVRHDSRACVHRHLLCSIHALSIDWRGLIGENWRRCRLHAARIGRCSLWRRTSSKGCVPLVEDARRIPDWCVLFVADDLLQSVASLSRRHLMQMWCICRLLRYLVAAAMVRQLRSGANAMTCDIVIRHAVPFSRVHALCRCSFCHVPCRCGQELWGTRSGVCTGGCRMVLDGWTA